LRRTAGAPKAIPGKVETGFPSGIAKNKGLEQLTDSIKVSRPKASAPLERPLASQILPCVKKSIHTLLDDTHNPGSSFLGSAGHDGD
jgi:hypothetical protein